MRTFPPAFWQLVAAAELPAKKSQALLEELGTSSLSPMAALLDWEKLTKAERARIEDANQKALTQAMDRGVQILTPPPYRVDKSAEFPVVLFADGDLTWTEKPVVAIVGSRSSTNYGIAVAQKFAEHLSLGGVVVSSGGAAGIDTAAHEGALKGPSGTLAVLGTGVDKVYPARNNGLFSQIRNQGCLVSQFACGMPAKEYTFRLRNYTLAALSDAVLIVEAPEKSGALVTAHAALEQGKPVFVVPGNITFFGFKGSHQLIRDGATLVDHPDQILEELGLDPVGETQTYTSILPEAPTHAAVLAALDAEAKSAEKLCELTSLSSPEVMMALTELELMGRIIRTGIGYSIRP